MKRLSLTLVLLLSLIGLLNAQVVSKGPVLSALKKDVYHPKITGEDESSFFVIARENDLIYLEAYDKSSLERNYKLEFDQWKNKKFDSVAGKYLPMAFHQVSDRFLVFYVNNSSKLEKGVYSNLFVQSYDVNDGSLVEEKLLLQMERGKSKMSLQDYSFGINLHNQELTIQFKAYNAKEKINIVRFVRINSNLTFIDDVETEKPENENHYHFLYSLESEGSIIDHRGRIYKIDGSLKNLSVNVYDPDEKYEKEAVEFELSNDENILTHISDYTLHGNSLLISGIYFSLEENRLAGSFFVSIDTDRLEVTKNTLTEFPKKVVEDHYALTDPIKHMRETVRDNFVLTQSIPSKDGVYILTEEYLKVTNVNLSTGATERHDEVFGNILIMYYSYSGNLEWVRLIPKLQRYSTASSISGASYYPFKRTKHYSFYCGIHNDDLVVLFNDNPINPEDCRNLTEITSPLVKMKNPVVKEYVFDENTGDFETRNIRGFNSEDMVFSPNPIFQHKRAIDVISPHLDFQREPNEASFLFLQKGKSYQFARYDP